MSGLAETASTTDGLDATNRGKVFRPLRPLFNRPVYELGNPLLEVSPSAERRSDDNEDEKREEDA